MSVLPRLHRLFAADGKCLNVAIDHGFFNERSFLQGIEDIGNAVRTLLQARPDAIQLTAGQAKHLQFVPYDRRPALVLRTDVANVYGNELPRTLFSHLMDESVEQAIRIDAACVVVNLLQITGEPGIHQQCVMNISRLKPMCERFGMPLMIEPLVMQSQGAAGGYMVDGNLNKIVPLVRQAAELGADIIKADPCDRLEEYHCVIQAASGCPVLPRGGGKVSDTEALRRTKLLMEQGARGIVYGRNIIQHAHPEKMTGALMAIIHDNSDVAEAASLLE